MNETTKDELLELVSVSTGRIVDAVESQDSLSANISCSIRPDVSVSVSVFDGDMRSSRIVFFTTYRTAEDNNERMDRLIEAIRKGDFGEVFKF